MHCCFQIAHYNFLLIIIISIINMLCAISTNDHNQILIVHAVLLVFYRNTMYITTTPWPNKNASILFGIIFQKLISKNEQLFHNKN